jgi:glycosyltransferase involved in cell wall biosynthesis
MLRTTRPDVLLVESTPPLLVVSGAIASAARGVPLVHVIHDLYPDVAEALGTLTASGPLARGLRRLHRWALHRCATVITLGPDMEERVAGSYGVPRETLRVISNWADVDALRVAADEVERLRDQWRLQGRKVVMYSGNLGMAHSFAEILAVADRWRSRSDTVFLFVGTGVAAEAVAQRARDRQLENIVFKPHQAWSALGVSLSAADVHLITQRPETLGMLVPSKLYGIMAVGRPAVFVGPDDSEVARTLQEAGAGFTVAPGDVGALERVLESLLSDPGLQRTCGEAGRRYMRERGSRARRTEAYRQVLEHAAGR